MKYSSIYMKELNETKTNWHLVNLSSTSTIKIGTYKMQIMSE